jgi:hypothetical protein
MSVFDWLMIGGWTAAFAMFGFCALKESGQLLVIHKRIGVWLENSAAQFKEDIKSMQPEEDEEVA